MNFGRRRFLQTLVAATASAVALEIDPERLLWQPGAKTFFIPDTSAPKNLITDAGQINAAYVQLATIPPEIRAGLRHETMTAIGLAKFDGDWNLLTLNGRPITSARKAADFIASKYTAFGPRATNDFVAQIAAKRAQAGLQDDVRAVVQPRLDFVLLG